MDRTEHIDALLSRLTLASGIGYCGTVQEVIIEELRKYGIDAHSEKDGSVVACIRGKEDYGVLLACHLDEIGLMVSLIDDAGRLNFSTIGGIDGRVLPGQEVIVHGKKDFKGYIGAKPPHLMSKEERDKTIPVESLFVDLGLTADVVKQYVSIGDYITFDGVYSRLQNGLRAVKSLDNRASVACGILALGDLIRSEHQRSIYFVATAQEEYTGIGARIHSYRLAVECACVVDVTFGEHPELSEHEYYPLNKGPTIGRGSTISEKLYRVLKDIAEQLEIPYSIEAMPVRTGTDAEDIAFNREGIPTCVIGIPVRYMHTPVEVVALKDIERTQRLIVGFLERACG
jgi:putative aminopeptidase FrvX